MLFTKTDRTIVFVKKNLPCDKACDIEIQYKCTFMYIKIRFFDYFCHFFYAVEQSLAFLSHK